MKLKKLLLKKSIAISLIVTFFFCAIPLFSIQTKAETAQNQPNIPLLDVDDSHLNEQILAIVDYLTTYGVCNDYGNYSIKQDMNSTESCSIFYYPSSNKISLFMNRKEDGVALTIISMSFDINNCKECHINVEVNDVQHFSTQISANADIYPSGYAGSQQLITFDFINNELSEEEANSVSNSLFAYSTSLWGNFLNTNTNFDLSNFGFCSFCDHSWEADQIITNPTCGKDGSKKHICEECSYVEYSAIPATSTEHVWNFDYTVDKAPTCTEEGSESIHCSICDEIQEGSARSIEKINHVFTNWTTTLEPTCTKTGSKERVCTVCGLKERFTIPSTGHVWNTEYTIEKEATLFETGLKSIHCQVCDAKKPGSEQVIPVKKLSPGWNDIDGTWYYCDASGNFKTGWLLSGSSWYYLDPASGAMLTGVQTINGSMYYLASPSGAMKTGWIADNGNWYYAGSSGAFVGGWIKSGNYWYYMNPTTKVMMTGWVKDGNSWYYMSSSGAMCTGWVQVGNAWYYMNSSGVMQTGWLKSGSTWYYLTSSGAMATGWQAVGGKWYYFYSSGAMAIGWVQVGNTWYYMNSSGAMMTGWQAIGGNWYFFNSSGAMLTGWKYIGGGMYYYYPSGKMASGSLSLNGYTYNFNSNGSLTPASIKVLRAAAFLDIALWSTKHANTTASGIPAFRETIAGIQYTIHCNTNDGTLVVRSYNIAEAAFSSSITIKLQNSDGRANLVFTMMDKSTLETICGGAGYINEATFNSDYPFSFTYFDGATGLKYNAAKLAAYMGTDTLYFLDHIINHYMGAEYGVEALGYYSIY